MPKRVADLLVPATPPARQPHAVIVEILREDPLRAYTCEEVTVHVRARLVDWSFTEHMPVTQNVAVTAALEDLIAAGIIVELPGGEVLHYQILMLVPER